MKTKNEDMICGCYHKTLPCQTGSSYYHNGVITENICINYKRGTTMTYSVSISHEGKNIIRHGSCKDISEFTQILKAFELQYPNAKNLQFDIKR